MSKSGKKRGWPPAPVALEHPVIDNHTHIALWEEEIPRRNGVRLAVAEQLSRAAQARVQAVISSACELPDWNKMVEFARITPGVFYALAIHPNEAPLHQGIVAQSPDGATYQPADYQLRYDLEAALAELSEQITAGDKLVAIGETGLDYFRTSELGKSAQIESFKAHIALAKETDLPMQIHDRQAHADTVAVLKEDVAPERTVFHCFSGDRELAGILKENGWFASFAGPITYPPNGYLREALSVLPRELVLVETDAPYLTPMPHRGQPNASYLLPWTVRYIAELWGCSEEEAAEQLWENTISVYGERLKQESLAAN